SFRRAAEKSRRARSSSIPTSLQTTPRTKIVVATVKAGPRAKVRRSISALLFGLGLSSARQQGGTRSDGCTGRARRRDRSDTAPGTDRKRIVKTALVPEVRLRAAETAVAGLNRETRAGVPFQRGAG